jgi:hypothetical protein
MVPAGSDAARRWPCSTTVTSGQAGTGSIDKPVPRLHDLEWLPRGAGRPRGPPAPPLRYAGDDVRDPAGIEGSARICSRVVVSVCAVMSPASSHMRAGVCHFVRRGGSQKIIGTGRSAMTSRTGSGSGLSVLPSFSQPRIGKCPLLVDRPDLVRRRVVKSLH